MHIFRTGNKDLTTLWRIPWVGKSPTSEQRKSGPTTRRSTSGSRQQTRKKVSFSPLPVVPKKNKGKSSTQRMADSDGQCSSSSANMSSGPMSEESMSAVDIKETRTPTPRSASKKNTKSGSGRNTISTPRKRRARRARLNYFQGSGVAKKRPSVTLNAHKKYVDSVPMKLKKLLESKKVCSAKKIQDLVVFEEELVDRYISVRHLNLKEDPGSLKTKEEILFLMEPQVSDLQCEIKDRKEALEKEREALRHSTHNSKRFICCKVCAAPKAL